MIVQDSLFDWVSQQKQQDKSLYTIVDPHSEYRPHVAFYQLDGHDGGPLLRSEQLTNPQDGPWLLPVNDTYLEWWKKAEHAQSGIIVSTNQPIDIMRAHFASLFQAILLGEIVFFPFYQPGYLGAMLPRLFPEEVNVLLSHYCILLFNEQQWQSYEPMTNKAHTAHTSPWWVMKEHHLDSPRLVIVLSTIKVSRSIRPE